KWKWWTGSKWKIEEKVQINEPASKAIKALLRVACFSWDMHSSRGSKGSIVKFPQNTYIAASHSSPGIPYLPKDAKVYYISDLPPGSLSHLVCVFILNCTGPDEDADSKAMVDEIYNKGANFVGSVIGGPITFANGIAVAKKFWRYACKGYYSYYYYQGQLYYQWHLCSLPEALSKAVRKVYGGGSTWIEGAIEHIPYYKGGGYLAPARGGKSDEILKIMGPNP
ncbi:MAG: hypothetical protein ACP5QS_07425, partial [bacterium]